MMYEEHMSTHPQAHILGELLAMPAMFFVLPNARRIAEFAAQSLSFVPGVKNSLLCLFELDLAHDNPISPLCRKCCFANALPPPSTAVECALSAISEFYVLRLNSLHHTFGFLVIQLGNAQLFEHYAPFLVNYSQFIILTLENRAQEKRLTQTMRQLEADIHTRRQIEDELRRHRNTLKEAQRIAHFGNWEWDSATDSLVASEEVYHILGLPPRAHASTYAQFCQRIHPEDQARFHATIDECLHAGTLTYDLHYRILRPNGDIRVVHGMGEAVQQSDSNTVKILSILHDVTAQVEIEQRLREAVTKAESANHAKSTFLSSMSHELRTPLNGILGYAQILNQNPSLTSDIRDKVDSIQRCGEYLLTLINDVLDIAKIEAGRLELQPHDMDLQGMFEDVAHFFRMKAAQKDVFFDYERYALTPTTQSLGFPVTVYADEKRLRQILLNLLSNAIKFTSKGAVSLRVGYDIDKMRVEVKDNGCGIAAHELENIFEAFQQVGCSQKKHEGTGLGLSICRQLLTLMGATIHVDSVVGQGSCFWFELPLQVREWGHVTTLDISPYSRRVSGYRGTPQHILILDEIALNRAVMRDLLTPLGFQVREAANVAQFHAAISALKADIIFMNLSFVAELGHQYSTIPIFALSPNVFAEQRAHALAAGCRAFLSQPLLLEELLTTLTQHCGIEWLYMPESSPSETLEPLPHDILEELSTLTQMGDVLEIITILEKFERNCPQKWLPCCRKLLALANNCNMNRLLEFIQICLIKTH
jgi:signal transduction histidine kinase